MNLPTHPSTPSQSCRQCISINSRSVGKVYTIMEQMRVMSHLPKITVVAGSKKVTKKVIEIKLYFRILEFFFHFENCGSFRNVCRSVDFFVLERYTCFRNRYIPLNQIVQNPVQNYVCMAVYNKYWYYETINCTF